MSQRMRVVTPYRPFPPESQEHLDLGPFDWIGAIEMLRQSVRISNECETVAITDVDTTLPGKSFQFETTERRLMLWILEVAYCYLASPRFDRDTIMLSPDSLVYRNLRPWFAGDFGIVVRSNYPERPILNAVQWWPVQSRDALLRLYESAIHIAHKLPENLIVWGADSEPFRRLLKPIRPGFGPRPKLDLRVNLVDSRDVLEPLSSDAIEILERRRPVHPKAPIVDFRFTRKHYMRAYFDATIGAMAA